MLTNIAHYVNNLLNVLLIVEGISRKHTSLMLFGMGNYHATHVKNAMKNIKLNSHESHITIVRHVQK